MHITGHLFKYRFRFLISLAGTARRHRIFTPTPDGVYTPNAKLETQNFSSPRCIFGYTGLEKYATYYSISKKFANLE